MRQVSFPATGDLVGPVGFGAMGMSWVYDRQGLTERAKRDVLRRLRTDVIDLYYVHSLDPDVPLEDTWGTMAELVQAGKVRSIGMSEVSVEQLERAQAIHPVAAVQSEYSLWTRDPDGSGTTSDGDAAGDVISWCRDHDAAFVPFSPVGRGYFSGRLTGRSFSSGDFRSGNPRFTPEARASNDQRIMPVLDEVARKHEVTSAAVVIAWTLLPERQGGSVITIPGTTDLEHLAENARAADLQLDDEDVTALNGIPAPAESRY